MPNQTHGGTIWHEQAGSGAAKTVVPAFLKNIGGSIEFSYTGPDEYGFFDVGGGTFQLMDLATGGGADRVRFVNIGGNIIAVGV